MTRTRGAAHATDGVMRARSASSCSGARAPGARRTSQDTMTVAAPHSRAPEAADDVRARPEAPPARGSASEREAIADRQAELEDLHRAGERRAVADGEHWRPRGGSSGSPAGSRLRSSSRSGSTSPACTPIVKPSVRIVTSGTPGMGARAAPPCGTDRPRSRRRREAEPALERSWVTERHVAALDAEEQVRTRVRAREPRERPPY